MGTCLLHGRCGLPAASACVHPTRCLPQELSRLLSAMASLRAARPNYRPCQYDVADICGGLLTSNLRELAAPHLASGEAHCQQGGLPEGWFTRGELVSMPSPAACYPQCGLTCLCLLCLQSLLRWDFFPG